MELYEQKLQVENRTATQLKKKLQFKTELRLFIISKDQQTLAFIEIELASFKGERSGDLVLDSNITA